MEKNKTLTHGNIGSQGIQSAIDSLISIKKKYIYDEELSIQINDILYNLEYAGEMMDESIQLHFHKYLSEISPQVKEGVLPNFNLWIGGDFKCNLPPTSSVYGILLEHYKPVDMFAITKEYLTKCPKDAEVVQTHISRIIYFYQKEHHLFEPKEWIPLLQLFWKHLPKKNINIQTVKCLITTHQAINKETLPILFETNTKLTTSDIEFLKKIIKDYDTESFLQLPWYEWKQKYQTVFFQKFISILLNYFQTIDKGQKLSFFERELLGANQTTGFTLETL